MNFLAIAVLGALLALDGERDSWEVERLIYDLDTAEGPVWTSDGKLQFTEIFAHAVHEHTVETGDLRTIRAESGGSNGMAVDGRGRLLMCEMLGGRVNRMTADGALDVLWEADGSGRGGPNDVVVSALGNAYFTMPREGRVYRVAPDDELAVLIEGLPGINGVMLSRNAGTLYVTEYRNRRVRSFSLDDEEGIVGDGELFAEIRTEGAEHGADGMAVDDQDRIYVSCLGGIWIFDADGNLVGKIEMPGEKVTNCALAGQDYDTLYVTTQQGLFRATIE